MIMTPEEPSNHTRLTICVGGGGVGKTTTSAALALSFAKRSKRTLVVTVDPARRLADALGTSVGRHAQEVAMPDAHGHLFARMPDSRKSLDDFVNWLFENPSQRQHFQQNPAYRELSNSLAGVHELITIGLLQTEVDAGTWDEVVLDTAPSRHALAFLSYPTRLLGLLEAKALGWLASIAKTSDSSSLNHQPMYGLFAWGRSKADAMMEKILGAEGLKHLSSLFSDMLTVRGRWAQLARRTERWMNSSRTRYVVIAAPTAGATADAVFLLDKLAQNHVHPSVVLLNCAQYGAPNHEQTLMQALQSLPPQQLSQQQRVLQQTLQLVRQEHNERTRAAMKAHQILTRACPAQTPIVSLPYVYSSDPRSIVESLATTLTHISLDTDNRDLPFANANTDAIRPLG